MNKIYANTLSSKIFEDENGWSFRALVSPGVAPGDTLFISHAGTPLAFLRTGAAIPEGEPLMDSDSGRFWPTLVDPEGWKPQVGLRYGRSDSITVAPGWDMRDANGFPTTW